MIFKRNAIGMSANIGYRVIPCLKAGVQFSYGISNFEEEEDLFRGKKVGMRQI